MDSGGSNTPYPQVTPLKTPSIMFGEDRPFVVGQPVVTVTPTLDLQDAARGLGPSSCISVTNAAESVTVGATRWQSRRLE